MCIIATALKFYENFYCTKKFLCCNCLKNDKKKKSNQYCFIFKQPNKLKKFYKIIV